ncbi:MAG: Fur family transcriptional regulator [Ruminococcaceae bacterium]|nr:Fur family transcriptional regulator [Oscillospiraceae bacterium]
MAEYRTEQKTMLSDFLRANREHAYTVDELAEGMRLSYGEAAPGKSTVYRLMTHLVEEGTVKRFVKGHSRRFVYQIVGGADCHSHLHLKCMECGKLLHLDEEVSERLLRAVRSSNDFSVDEEETVLFGACAVCMQSKRETGGKTE